MAKPYRGKAIHLPSLPLAAPVAVLAVLLSPHARADWKVQPSVTLRETYSDNVRQESDEFARSQFISELAPSLTINDVSPRLKLHAQYTQHLYAYSNDQVEGTNRSQRQLAARANAKLVEDLLFFDGSASMGQQSISAFGPQPTGNDGYSNVNRTDVRTYRLSPYLTHRFGSAAKAELRYSRDSVKSDAIGLAESVADSVSLSIASGPAYRMIGWSLLYNHQNLESKLAGKSVSDNAAANLIFRASDRFSINAGGGYDKYDYQALGGTTAGKSYSLGFTWAPTLRTSVQASAGRRYYGSSYSLIAAHRSRSSVWNLNYSDAVTSTRDQFLLPATLDTAALLDRLFTASIPDPQERQQAVDAYIRATGLPPSLADNINYFSNRYVLQKQLQASAAFNTARTTTIFTLSANKRNALSSQQSDSTLLGSSVLNLNDNTRQAAVTLASNYRFNSRTAVNLVLSANRSESLSTGLDGNQKLLSVAMTRQLQRKLKGSIELRRSQGSAPTQRARNYRENAISASLSMQL